MNSDYLLTELSQEQYLFDTDYLNKIDR
jgi:hypothetical protein